MAGRGLHKTPCRPSNCVVTHKPEAGRDATLVTAWTSLCQELAPGFTAPTLLAFVHLVTGWTMCFDVGGVLISRLRGDSALYALPPTRRPKGKRGSPPRRGRRLPTPKAMAKSPRGWRTAYVTLHGKRVRRRIKSRVCLWWHVAKDHPIKVVIVKNPSGKGRDDYLFSTDVSMSDRRVIGHYAARWPVEEAIHDAKQHDGLERTAGWCERTVLRQAPMALFKQTLVKAWYIRHDGKLEKQPAAAATPRPWQPPKNHPSYRDMLSALRRTLWQTRVKALNSEATGRVDDAVKSLMFTLCEAA